MNFFQSDFNNLHYQLHLQGDSLDYASKEHLNYENIRFKSNITYPAFRFHWDTFNLSTKTIFTKLGFQKSTIPEQLT